MCVWCWVKVLQTRREHRTGGEAISRVKNEAYLEVTVQHNLFLQKQINKESFKLLTGTSVGMLLQVADKHKRGI